MKIYKSRGKDKERQTQKLTKDTPEGGKGYTNLVNMNYENLTNKKHSEEESTQAMKINFSILYKITTENAPGGGKTKAMKTSN